MHKNLHNHQKPGGARVSHPGVAADPVPGGRYHFSRTSRSWLGSRVGCYLLLFCLLLGSMPLLANGPGEGSIERDFNPTVITTAQQLSAIRNNLAGNYILGNDIDLSGTEWVPIVTNPGQGGTSEKGFTGTLDGNGYKVTGLKINKPSQLRIALIGFMQGGIIKNLGLEVDQVTGGAGTASLVSYLQGGTVTNCYVKGKTLDS